LILAKVGQLASGAWSRPTWLDPALLKATALRSNFLMFAENRRAQGNRSEPFSRFEAQILVDSASRAFQLAGEAESCRHNRRILQKTL
jgi:hypothetical protein